MTSGAHVPMKYTPMVTSRNGTWRNMRRSGMTDCPGFGGRRERTSETDTQQHARMMKPITLVAHAKPTFGNSCCRVSGKMIPPNDPPIAPRPVAYPLFSRKKWLMAASAGVKISDVPMPPSTPNTSMKCQYAVQRPMRNMLRQRQMLPARTSRRGP